MQRGFDSGTMKRCTYAYLPHRCQRLIGGAVASPLIADGHEVCGLVRDQGRASAVAAHRIEAVIGALDDTALLQNEARTSDGVVNAANSDHRGAVEALISGLAGSGKPLIHTSGTSNVADRAMGEPSDRILYEDTTILRAEASLISGRTCLSRPLAWRRCHVSTVRVASH